MYVAHDDKPVAAIEPSLALLGTVVATQVQICPLKPGSARFRAYDPTPIVEAVRLHVDRHGCTGVLANGGRVLDVHHTAHPSTRDPRGDRGISFASNADYDVLRFRFGQHLADGTAGESVRIDSPVPLAGRDLSAGVVVQGANGRLVPLDRVRPASPCVEFVRFVLGRPAGSPVDDQVRATLTALDGGARGFYAVASVDMVIARGDRLWLRTAQSG